MTVANSFFTCLAAAMIQEMAKDELLLLDERRRKEEFTAPEDFPDLYVQFLWSYLPTFIQNYALNMIVCI